MGHFVDLKTLRNELKERTTKMNSSLSLSSSYEFSSKNTRATSEMRNLRGSSEVSNEFYTAMNTDLDRLNREFYYPQPIKETGNYYPRFRCTGGTQTGSCPVSYLARPYYFYSVPSKYGFSKYCTVRKIGVW